ncbi:MAG: tetratricopeptide repeat protein [Desulfobulbaceae bacterium]|nr:tetratricopeptide repeat protein [Desulfobulbaceae bacterium]MCK5339616.1 tetratricopeptide repeat protein [Desulfobulbaceae bacterium]
MSDKVEGYVKKETMLLIAAAALIAGFLAGVVFSAMQSSPGGPPAPTASQQQPAPSQGMGLSPEQANKILALQQEVSTNPDNAGAWAQLGHIWFDTNQFEKAIHAYNKSLAIRPNDPNVLTDLGVMFRRSGQPVKAVESFDKAMGIDPKHEIARFNKGIVLYNDLNQQAQAIQVWEEMARMNPLAKAPDGRLLTEFLKDVKERQK